MKTSISTATKIESAHDILHESRRRPITPIFAPKTIAVVGATEREHSVGRTVMDNLIKGGFPGKIFPVNPTKDTILGMKAYPSITALPERPDLAVIITPPKTIPGIIKECAQTGVPGAIIISAGFKEIGAEGAELERQVMAEARARQHAHRRPELSGRHGAAHEN